LLIIAGMLNEIRVRLQENLQIGRLPLDLQNPDAFYIEILETLFPELVGGSQNNKTTRKRIKSKNGKPSKTKRQRTKSKRVQTKKRKTKKKTTTKTKIKVRRP
jgi:hypothetical protein